MDVDLLLGAVFVVDWLEMVLMVLGLLGGGVVGDGDDLVDVEVLVLGHVHLEEEKGD